MIIDRLEEIKECRELEVWSDLERIPGIDLERIEELVKHPPQLCEDKSECQSRYVSGEYCKCIRTVFPHKEHYEYYKSVVKNRLEYSFELLVFKRGNSK